MNTPPLIAAGLEVVLHRLLGVDADVRAALDRSRGRRVRVVLAGFFWQLDLVIAEGGRVVVLADDPGEADVTVRGPVPGLVLLAVRESSAGRLPVGVEVEGDVEWLAELRRVLAGLDLDAEELLAGAVGGAAAHRIGRGLRAFFSWGRQSLQTLGLDAAEYLREESYTLARAQDTEAHAREVEDLREAVDRFEARLARLERQVADATDLERS